ncbi:MAG: hypothetical protein H7A47_04875 [Verrucomicrobiales bacterium]|nr:hypothetical protein [Verrucomicrobiales bacterium]
MPSKRKAIPEEVKTRVMVACRRRCCLCWHLDRDDREKKGQIAHLDHDHTNPAESNLAFLCFKHHEAYDATSKQAKGISIGEVRHALDELKQHLAALALPSSPSASAARPDDPLPSAPSAFDQRGHPQNSAGKPTPRRKPATKGRTARRPSGPCKDRSEPDNRVARPSVSPDPADAESDLHPSVWQEIRTLFAQDPKLAVDVSSALDHGAGEDRDTWAVLAALVHQEGLVEALRRIRDWLVDQRSVRDPKAWEALVWHLASLGVRDINWLESMRGRLSDARVGKLLELAFEEIEVPGKAWPFAAELYVAAVKDRSTQYIPDASLPPQAWRGVNHVELISPEDLSSPSDLPHVRLRDFVQRILRVNHYPVDDDHERNLETLKDFLHERDPKERFYAIYQEKEPLFDQPLIREMLLLLRYDPKGERRIDRLAGIPEVLRQLLKKLRELDHRA